MSLVSPSPPLSELTTRQVSWIAGGFLCTFGSMAGQTIFISLFGTQIRAEFGLSHGEFGFLYTISTLCSALCLIWAGSLADRWPARRLAIISLAGRSATALLMSNANSIVILGIVLFLLRFFGQGMLTHISSTSMSRWFNRFRGRALAFAQLGFSIGEALLPFAVAVAIAAIGWRQVWLAVAVSYLVFFIPVIAYFFSDPPDGRKAMARGYVNPDGGGETGASGESWTRRAVVRDPLFWIVLTGLLAMPALSTAIFFHQTHLVAAKGWSLVTFASFFPVLAGTAVGSSLLTGMAVDRIGAWRILPFLLVPFTFAILVLWAGKSELTIPFFFMLAGMTGGMMHGTVGAIWAELYGTAHIGSIRALSTSGMVLASAVGPGIVGALIDLGVDLPSQTPGFAVYCLLCSMLYLLTYKKLGLRVAGHKS